MLQVRFFLLLGILSLSLPGILESCYYAKFTPDHSACLPPSPTCRILQRGVTEKDKQQILDLHNQYRSQIANGKEKQAGGMPESSNMMELAWDDELASISQNYAEQCTFRHDCNECRQVDRFPVGQNLCFTGSSAKPSDFDWPTVMQTYYDEVEYFNKKDIKPYAFEESYAHFTQLAWATSRLVGCGAVMYDEDGFYSTIYVCNYGPAGNLLGGEMYKVGNPCSSCPANSTCIYSGQESGLCGAANTIGSSFTTTKTPAQTKQAPSGNSIGTSTSTKAPVKAPSVQVISGDQVYGAQGKPNHAPAWNNMWTTSTTTKAPEKAPLVQVISGDHVMFYGPPGFQNYGNNIGTSTKAPAETSLVEAIYGDQEETYYGTAGETNYAEEEQTYYEQTYDYDAPGQVYYYDAPGETYNYEEPGQVYNDAQGQIYYDSNGQRYEVQYW